MGDVVKETPLIGRPSPDFIVVPGEIHYASPKCKHFRLLLWQSVFNAYPVTHLRSPSFCRIPDKNYKQRKKLHYKLNIQHLCFRRYRLSSVP